MRISTLFLVTVVVLSLTSCEHINSQNITGSGRMVSVSPDVPHFTRISVGTSFDVELVQGNGYDVTIEIDDNLEEYLVAEVQDRTLHLSLAKNNGYSDVHLKASLVVPDLEAIQLHGAASIQFDQFDVNHPFAVFASGASHVSGGLNAEDVQMEVDGASTVSITGSCDDLKVEGSGASTIEAGNFRCGDTDVDLNGASEARVFTDGRLNAFLSGASTLRYTGKTELGTVETHGSSHIREAR